MSFKLVEKAYPKINQAIELLEQKTNLSYLECFVEFGEALVDGGEIDGSSLHLADDVVAQLSELQQAVLQLGLTKEQWRIVVQLVLLNSYRREKIQANHQITPDTIGYLVAYLLQHVCLKKRDTPIKLLDLTVGSANLLTTVVEFLTKQGYHFSQLSGVDNDDLMLAIASVNAALQRVDVDLYHQDAIGALSVAASDVIIADLPVGYYPLDERVTNFKTKAKKGHSYAHHLLIEQALVSLNPAGWGVFLVPSNLFTTDEAKTLVTTIQEFGHFQGLVQLPANLFGNAAAQKSILLVQKKGKDAKQAQQVLLGTMPAINQKAELQAFLGQVQRWKTANLD